LRSASKKPARKNAPVLAARLAGRFSLQTQADGSLAAALPGYSVGLGKLTPAATAGAKKLATGISLAELAGRSAAAKELGTLVHRLARHGLIEYRLAAPRDDEDLVVIEPQVSDYWPKEAKLGDRDTVVLSRFAYLRRRGNDLVLESPRAGALLRICDPGIAGTLAALARPQKVGRLRREAAFFDARLLALLLDCDLLLRLDAKHGEGLRANEGDSDLVMWDFHDLVFHTRSTEGRQANPLGGGYPHAGVIAPLPAVRPSWPGKPVALSEFSGDAQPLPPFAKLLRDRHSVRDFDDAHPITLAELARFLDRTSRVLAEWRGEPDVEAGVPEVDFSTRPYPSAGSAYELELYLLVANCDGLARGFYHYDAGAHALVEIGASPQHCQAMSAAAEYAMDAPGAPQVLITIAARFGRVSWKYSSIAYALILKDVGSLIQTFYLAATDMGLGGCAIGTTNINVFARMTGLAFHVEGPVGQFALGRGRTDAAF
jgi:SagB-type dehydrogenase family enzyme